MIRTIKSVFDFAAAIALTVGLSAVALISSTVLSISPEPAYASDYDRDSRDDLQAVRVKRSSAGRGRTDWAIRRSSDGRVLKYAFSAPGDALFHSRRTDGRFYPGIVYVKSARVPLVWILKAAKGESRFSWGRPGDRIPNQQDVNRDRYGDFTVVRALADGSLQWLFRFSNGKTASTIFGRTEDRVFLGPDGMLIRVTPEFLWQGRFYDQSQLALDVQWGQVGDIPIAPRVSAQAAVARQNGANMTIYIWNPNHTTQTIDVPTGVPALGYFFRSRELSAVALVAAARTATFMKLNNPETSTARFGDTRSAFVLPTNQVYQPGESGQFGTVPGNGGGNSGDNSGGNNGGGNNQGGDVAASLQSQCPVIRAIRPGEIWKSIASTHIPNTDPRRFSTSFITRNNVSPPSESCLLLLDSRGNKVHQLGEYFPTGSSYSSRNYGGSGCGDKKSPVDIVGEANRNTGAITTYLKINATTCISIPNANTCYNSSQCP